MFRRYFDKIGSSIPGVAEAYPVQVLLVLSKTVEVVRHVRGCLLATMPALKCVVFVLPRHGEHSTPNLVPSTQTNTPPAGRGRGERVRVSRTEA
jgi:hypothetical protein